MAGITATISLQAFRADWETHMPISALCVRYSVTKDQVIRLRTVWNLPLRTDRRLRYKPKKSDYRDPTPREIKAACRAIQSLWDDKTREDRRVTKSDAVNVRFIRMSDIATPDDEGIE